MIDIRDFLAKDLAAGQEFGIEAKVMLWLNAGSGQVLALEPKLLALEGKIQVVGVERSLSMQIALGEPFLDEQGNVTGPCTLRVAAEADGEAVYRVEGERLQLLGTIGGQATRIIFKRDGRHTQVELDGERKATLRLTAG